MQDIRTKQSYMAEAGKFNTNASKLILKRGPDALIGLFATLGYQCRQQGNSYRMPCPICRDSFVWIATANPIAYPIYWNCFSGQCPSRTSKSFVKNLLGLVRACVEDQKLGTAYKVISTFLGFSRSFDITNMKPEAEDVPAPAKKPELGPERPPETMVRPRKPLPARGWRRLGL